MWRRPKRYTEGRRLFGYSSSPQGSPRGHRRDGFCYARCNGRLTLLLMLGVLVVFFGIVSVHYHKSVHRKGRTSASGSVKSSIDNYLSNFNTPSSSSTDQEQGVAWRQTRKQTTKDMFKIIGNRGSSTNSAGVVKDSANAALGGGDSQEQQSILPKSSQDTKPFAALPDWTGQGDHKFAVSGNTVATDAQKNEWTTDCDTYDHSIRRPRHGCQVNKDTRNVFCNFEQLRIDNSKIEMAHGGEELSTVMGQAASVEFPVYQRGAFSVPIKPDFQVPTQFRSGQHYLEDVLNALRYPTLKNNFTIDLMCDETYPGITMFTTRYEYVNLYHTLTDWWSAYFALPEDYYGKEHRVVFLDAHPQGGLDEVWHVLFGDVHFIKHFPQGKGLCFERAVFIPAGYKSPLFPDVERTRCPQIHMAGAFADFVLGRYHLESVQVVPGDVVIVDRQPYVAHPRSDASKFQRSSENFEKLQINLQKIKGVNAQLVRLEKLSFGEQLKVIRKAHVLVGNHGAALSHLMFMDRLQSHVIEFTITFNDFFTYLSEWRGIDHNMILINALGDEQIDRIMELVTQFVVQ